jgi:hypothetical protein
MGLGKQRAKLDGELFRRTEEQPEPPKKEQPVIQGAVPTTSAKEKVTKERFSLYLEPTIAKRLRLYAVQHDIKNINGLVASLIEGFLEKEGA